MPLLPRFPQESIFPRSALPPSPELWHDFGGHHSGKEFLFKQLIHHPSQAAIYASIHLQAVDLRGASEGMCARHQPKQIYGLRHGNEGSAHLEAAGGVGRELGELGLDSDVVLRGQSKEMRWGGRGLGEQTQTAQMA